MKIFISGSKNIKEFNIEIINVLNRIIKNNNEVLVGDCEGVDTLIHSFMKSKNYKKTTIYHVGTKPRNNHYKFNEVKIKTSSYLTPYQYYQQKDIQMTKDADAGFVIWDEKSNGSKDNICRLMQNGKPVIIYSTKQNKLLKGVRI